MIVANLATYPARRAAIPGVLAALAPQVDRLNLVLNEYDTVPDEARGFDNVNPILPPRDLKDVGKFYPDVAGADWVLMVDDDVIYPPDFVARSVAQMERFGDRGILGGYHGSIYARPKFSFNRRKFARWLSYRDRNIQMWRRNLTFYKELTQPTVVDQIATNAAILRADLMPGFAYMEDSQRFVDVRLAKWCFEHGILPVCLARPADWLRPVRYEETIFDDFTRSNHAHVAREIWSYAFKVPGRGGVLADR
ncbi:glycosyltransferase family A protein [Tropicimonas sp.]|uniref:glycosyltransferase family A protein n=1 Tax=Tropicimonas sp. TaxID=2067044 RepID=UPI003A835880